jgi:aconitate hydratase
MRECQIALETNQDPWDAVPELSLYTIYDLLVEKEYIIEEDFELIEQMANNKLSLDENRISEKYLASDLNRISDMDEDSEIEPFGFGSLIYATKPGDGSAREQAASCQKVLGGWANIAVEYATKRYRSNLINWGILPFQIPAGELPFHNLDYIWIPNIREAIVSKQTAIEAFCIPSPSADGQKCAENWIPFTLTLGELTDKERRILLNGCLINDNRV